ncbi:glutaredoxin family protein [Piscibacillus salipiscarius]|uniref:Glutaredoxin family protein n=1 Tax=Piscibacillus salipiscarius TaxID=299480 RepID=A0ABW5QCZ9_9BACI
MKQVNFYTKPNCKLCDEIKEMLETYKLMYEFEIVEQNIEQDDQLLNKYFLTIPVVKVNNQELDVSELNAGSLDDLLKENLTE